MGRKLIDLMGQTFGRLTVVDRDTSDLHGCAQWRCSCECGGSAVVRGADLRSGHTRSCGCLWRETSAAANTKHGKHGTPEYKVWDARFCSTATTNRSGNGNLERPRRRLTRPRSLGPRAGRSSMTTVTLTR